MPLRRSSRTRPDWELQKKFPEGLSYNEITDIAQLAPGTVMLRLARAAN